MKKEIWMKIAYICCISLLLIIVTIYGIQFKIKKELNLVTTFIAAHDISPRTKITEKDLIEVEVPHAFLLDFSINNKAELIGKYTDIQGKIPAGSIFYKSMLYDEKKLPDYPTLQLKENQTAFSLETDLEKSGGCIAGQRVDLLITISRNNGITMSDCLITGARLISVKDHNGLDLTDEKSNKIPYIAILAVKSEDAAILAKAKTIGEISLLASGKSYQNDEAILCKESQCYQFLVASES